MNHKNKEEIISKFCNEHGLELDFYLSEEDDKIICKFYYTRKDGCKFYLSVQNGKITIPKIEILSSNKDLINEIAKKIIGNIEEVKQ